MGLLDLLSKNVWYLSNEDSTPPSTIQGQFPPEELKEETGNKYSVQTSLNRQNPIVQFLSGEADTLSFVATMFNYSGFTGKNIFDFGGDAKDDLDTLKSWKQRDENLGRPPILSFSVGDGMVGMATCIITSLGSITYDKPTKLGRFRRARLTVNLMRYEPFSLEASTSGETRYHRAALRDYYEMLTYREYGSAEMGDIIRKRHPTKPNIQPADIIKLPSKATLRREIIAPSSIVFQNATNRKSTPQRELMLAVLEERNRNYVSHIIQSDE
jgi:hypothetical protein